MMDFTALARKRHRVTVTTAVPAAVAALGAIGAIAAFGAILAWCFAGYLSPAFLVRLLYASSFCG
jgi:hypothetical protein